MAGPKNYGIDLTNKSSPVQVVAALLIDPFTGQAVTPSAGGGGGGGGDGTGLTNDQLRASPLQVIADAVTDAQLRAAPVPVTGPLTDTQLRATPVPVTHGGLTDTQLRAAPVPIAGAVTGPATDAQLRAAPLPVTGPLTDTQIRATPLPVSHGGLTDTQLRAASLAVTGPATNAELRATALPVTGPLTDTQLRASAIPVGGNEVVGAAPGTTRAGIIGAGVDAGGLKRNVLMHSDGTQRMAGNGAVGVAPEANSGMVAAGVDGGGLKRNMLTDTTGRQQVQLSPAAATSVNIPFGNSGTAGVAWPGGRGSAFVAATAWGSSSVALQAQFGAAWCDLGPQAGATANTVLGFELPAATNIRFLVTGAPTGMTAQAVQHQNLVR